VTVAIIPWDGRDYSWDTDMDLDVQEGVAIHLTYGLTVMGMFDGLKDADARAWQCQYWLLMKHNGVKVGKIADCSFPLLKFMGVWADAMKAAGATDDEDEPDPTNLPPSSPVPAPLSPVPASPTATIPAAVPVPQFAPSTAYTPSPSLVSAANTSSPSPASAT
jgi:hypothetical protein